jgi:hypothetical protein
MEELNLTTKPAKQITAPNQSPTGIRVGLQGQVQQDSLE